MVGSKRREDITDTYKYKEGTVENRAALGAKVDAKVHERRLEVREGVEGRGNSGRRRKGKEWRGEGGGGKIG